MPSRGKVYAWGIGGSGQLGSRIARSISTPQVVLGPWVSKNGTIAMETDSTSPVSEECVVKHIFCGGDHCFATVTQKEVFIIFKTKLRMILYTTVFLIKRNVS